MSKPRLLDLFCGAGGAAMGYSRAGFEVVGVDINPQPHYPFEFHQADAMTYPLDGFDAIHASPPCQDHSTLKSKHDGHGTGWMLEETIRRLKAAGVSWVVENVVGPTVTMDGWWFVLCGSMFDETLMLRRHRRFGSSGLMLAPDCRHDLQTPQFRSLDKRSKGTAAVVGAGDTARRMEEMNEQNADSGAVRWEADCGRCSACRIHHYVPSHDTTPPWQWGMIVCPTCGNKRCPHATDHRLACTGSNEPNQPGSDYQQRYFGDEPGAPNDSSESS